MAPELQNCFEKLHLLRDACKSSCDSEATAQRKFNPNSLRFFLDYRFLIQGSKAERMVGE